MKKFKHQLTTHSQNCGKNRQQLRECVERYVKLNFGGFMQRSYFLKETYDAKREITELYNFLWPTVASLWNMRWQVNGYLTVRPNATEIELNKRFNEGFDVQRINFKAGVVDKSWEDQQEEFARVLLTSSFAVYESWLAEVQRTLGYSEKLNKELQFPSVGSDGVWGAISTICKVESSAMKKAVYSICKKQDKYSGRELDNLMKCYRYFKECRNAFTHNGGICNQKLLDSYNEFLAIASTSDLKATEVPEHHPVIIGERVRLSIRGVVGLTDIILRIIITIDAELSRSKFAENHFVNVWNSNTQRYRNLKNTHEARLEQFKRYVRQIGFPCSKEVEELLALVSKNGFSFKK